MDEKQPENPPAFPSTAEHVLDGMTLRDYFAMHSPVKPERWFEPKMATPKPDLEWDHDHSKCGSENSTQMPWDCIPSNKDARDAWDAERDKQRLVQWPFAWADVMLAERSK